MAFDNEKWSPTAAEGVVDLPAFFIASHETTAGEFSISRRRGSGPSTRVP